MIRHLVIWKLKQEAKSGGRISDIEPIRLVIAAMREKLSGLKHLEVQSNQNNGADAADLLLYAEFDSWQSLQDYEAHPLHDDLRRLIGPIRVERRVFDHEM